MKKEAEILMKYAQADFAKRMYLFLQYPDLRAAFQQIEHCKFRCPNGFSFSTEQQNKEKCFHNFSA